MGTVRPLGGIQVKLYMVGDRPAMLQFVAETFPSLPHPDHPDDPRRGFFLTPTPQVERGDTIVEMDFYQHDRDALELWLWDEDDPEGGYLMSSYLAPLARRRILSDKQAARWRGPQKNPERGLLR